MLSTSHGAARSLQPDAAIAALATGTSGRRARIRLSSIEAVLHYIATRVNVQPSMQGLGKQTGAPCYLPSAAANAALPLPLLSATGSKLQGSLLPSLSSSAELDADQRHI